MATDSGREGREGREDRLVVGPTRTGAAFAIYEELPDGTTRRVRGHWPTRARAEAHLPRLAHARAVAARQHAISEAIAAGATVDEALSAHPPVPRPSQPRRLLTEKERETYAALRARSRRADLAPGGDGKGAGPP